MYYCSLWYSWQTWWYCGIQDVFICLANVLNLIILTQLMNFNKLLCHRHFKSLTVSRKTLGYN